MNKNLNKIMVDFYNTKFYQENVFSNKAFSNLLEFIEKIVEKDKK